jgi:uncharacterized protein involved in exopolysaccharide biosynthesis
MRKFNVELNRTKLTLKQQQLAQIETQLAALQLKLADVSERYNAKKLEVTQIETAIQAAQTAQPVSE